MTDFRSSPGLLVVWANIPAEHERDFNRWYDTEHVQERVAIDGFEDGTRYVAASGPRRYLGLYRTTSLAAFQSESYRQAFAHQTPWSVANLGRMTDCMRRVCAITAETGAGSGGWIALVRLGRPGSARDLSALAEAAQALQPTDGVIATRLLVPSPELSTPLPAESTANRLLDPILVVEATSQAVAEAARARVREAVAGEGEDAVLQLMWQLQAPRIAVNGEAS